MKFRCSTKGVYSNCIS